MSWNYRIVEDEIADENEIVEPSEKIQKKRMKKSKLTKLQRKFLY